MVQKFELNFELKFSKNLKKNVLVETYVKPNLVLPQNPFTTEGGGGVGGGGGVQGLKIKVAQNNMVLFWNF